ncbi:MAG: crotonase/enoyl-CoA hydratase family protein [Bacteroidota bacterium]
MTSPAFQLTINNYVAELSFNRPEKANSLDLAAWQEMRDQLVALGQNPEVRVIILSGQGKHFCAGIDLETLMSVALADTADEARKREAIRNFIYQLQDCISSIERCPKPVLAAVHGGCIGGGVDIITACDLRYCSEEAYFTIKETDLGLAADIGTLQRLPTIIQPGMVAELAFTARKVFGPEAARIGLVNNCYADQAALQKGVGELAQMMAAKSPLVLRGIKETLLYKRDHSVQDSLRQIATHNAAFLLSTDLAESFQAFMEKRAPDYKDA